jgi:hypothetical protein
VISNQVAEIRKEAAKLGFKINEFKTKEMAVNTSTDQPLTVHGRQMEDVKAFAYLGSTVTT